MYTSIYYIWNHFYKFYWQSSGFLNCEFFISKLKAMEQMNAHPIIEYISNTDSITYISRNMAITIYE